MTRKISLYRPAMLFLALIFFISTAASEESAPSAPHNVQIVVQMRQVGFQNQSGMQTSMRSDQTQFLVVSEGLEGKIFLGESVPYASYYQNYLTREGYLASQAVGIQFKDVGTSLIVRTRVVGDGRIEVTLTPEISYLTQDGRGSIAVQKMSTSVLVPEGQSMEIGGYLAQSEFNSNFYRNASGQALQITLTPKIVG